MKSCNLLDRSEDHVTVLRRLGTVFTLGYACAASLGPKDLPFLLGKRVFLRVFLYRAQQCSEISVRFTGISQGSSCSSISLLFTHCWHWCLCKLKAFGGQRMQQLFTQLPFWRVPGPHWTHKRTTCEPAAKTPCDVTSNMVGKNIRRDWSEHLCSTSLLMQVCACGKCSGEPALLTSSTKLVSKKLPIFTQRLTVHLRTIKNTKHPPRSLAVTLQTHRVEPVRNPCKNAGASVASPHRIPALKWFSSFTTVFIWHVLAREAKPMENEESCLSSCANVCDLFSGWEAVLQNLPEPQEDQTWLCATWCHVERCQRMQHAHLYNGHDTCLQKHHPPAQCGAATPSNPQLPCAFEKLR